MRGQSGLEARDAANTQGAIDANHSMLARRGARYLKP